MQSAEATAAANASSNHDNEPGGDESVVCFPARPDGVWSCMLSEALSSSSCDNCGMAAGSCTGDGLGVGLFDGVLIKSSAASSRLRT